MLFTACLPLCFGTGSTRGLGEQGAGQGLAEVPGETERVSRVSGEHFQAVLCCSLAGFPACLCSSLLPPIYHLKNQLEYVALLTLLAYVRHHGVFYSPEQVYVVGSFPSESFFIRNQNTARATISALIPSFCHQVCDEALAAFCF